MKIFISWSGERSRTVATALRNWLPYIFQDADPWVSSRDINAGSRWEAESKQRVGIVKYGNYSA